MEYSSWYFATLAGLGCLCFLGGIGAILLIVYFVKRQESRPSNERDLLD